MFKKLFSYLIGKDKPESKEIISSNSEVNPLNIASVKDNLEQVQEVSRFRNKSNLIEEGYWEGPPKMYTSSGNYYGKNDPRNTYDPYESKIVEDFDGKLITIGGTGGVIKEVVTKEDIELTVPGNKEELEHLNKLNEEWKKANGVTHYSSGMKK